MKRSGIDHPKTRRLARVLESPTYTAVGILESIWHFTAKHATRGDVGRWQDEEIAEAIGWPAAEADRLIRALVDCRFLDRSRRYRLVIHDWHHHADESVRKTLKARGETFATEDEDVPPPGENIGDISRSLPEESGKPPPDSEAVAGKVEPALAFPSLSSPEPPLPKKHTSNSNGTNGNHADDVEKVWTHYKTYRPKVRVLSQDVRRKIVARLRDGFSATDICRAVDGNFRSPHHCGQNETGTEYHDLELIVRSGAKVNQFLQVPEQPAAGATNGHAGRHRELDVTALCRNVTHGATE